MLKKITKLPVLLFLLLGLFNISSVMAARSPTPTPLCPKGEQHACDAGAGSKGCSCTTPNNQKGTCNDSDQCVPN